MIDGLGLFVFPAAHGSLSAARYPAERRHVTNNRVNRRRQRNIWGQNNDRLTLSGVPHARVTGGRLSLLALELMAEQGKAWPLIEVVGLSTACM